MVYSEVYVVSCCFLRKKSRLKKEGDIHRQLQETTAQGKKQRRLAVCSSRSFQMVMRVDGVHIDLIFSHGSQFERTVEGICSSCFAVYFV